MAGVAQLPHRCLRAGLLRFGRFQLPLHCFEPKPDRRRLALQGLGIDRVALGFERPRPRIELLDARFEMSDTGLLRMHRPGRLSLALAPRLELRLQGEHLLFDLPELAACVRRLFLQPGKCGLVDLEPRGQCFALPAFIFDLAFRRVEAPGFLAHRFGKLLAAPADRSDGFLGARDLRPRPEHIAITPVERIRGLGEGGSRFLQLRLGPALAGERRVEPALLIRDLRGVAACLLIERPPPQREVLRFEARAGPP